MRPTKLAIWNANGLQQHIHELKAFIADKQIDILLISETHFTEKSHLVIPNFKIYNTNHPAGTARGGTAVIVKNSISHVCNTNYETEHIQATSITVRDGIGNITVAAVYCPPKHSISEQQFQNFYDSFGQRFIAAGDCNAKHSAWGSRLVTPRGRELFKTMLKNNLSHISPGSPTYWPSDKNKLPDVIDFCITKGVPGNYAIAECTLDLSSDHTPIIVTIDKELVELSRPPFLHSKSTNWENFSYLIDQNLSTNINLRNAEDIENAIHKFNTVVQNAAWASTPIPNPKSELQNVAVKNKLKEKRHIRKIWQMTRDPHIKKKLNKCSKELKNMIAELENKKVETFLGNLTATEATDYSLWKATKRLHRQTNHSSAIKMENGEWAKSDIEKASTFGAYLSKVFQPFPRTVSELEENHITDSIHIPFVKDEHLKPIRKTEVQQAIKMLAHNKAPGYDLITPKILKELPYKAVTILTYIYNAILRCNHFPLQWKVAQVKLILKPGKPPEAVSSYRPISLLPVLSKLLENIILQRLKPIINERKLIPDHQFGFRQQHSTVEQVNRVYNIAREALEQKKYCTAAFLDISQAFDKVWHPGLLYKLKAQLPPSFYGILCSYLSERHFMVKINNEVTDLYAISSGVPQGSVLGPVLYTLFTADLPVSNDTYTATFADDTVIMAVHQNPIDASYRLQEHLNKIEKWLNIWRIKANESKSAQITFTLKNAPCPIVMMNGTTLPQAEAVKYLGICLDRRLTFRTHIFNKRKQLGLKLRSMYWLLDHSSKLSIHNKLLVYKTIVKPIWTYGIQLWGAAANSNIDIIQRFQSKILRIITNSPWFISNYRIHNDLNIPTVKEEIANFSANHINRLLNHENLLAKKLTNPNTRRLCRSQLLDLPSRFR